MIRPMAIGLAATLALSSTVESRPSDETGAATPDAASQLEQAFTGVADRTVPSVVGITIGKRDPDWTLEKQSAGRQEGWREANQNQFRYPGFRPARHGSGFVVSDDGYILSAYHVLHPSGTTEGVQLVDVEFTGDRHVTARVVGLEPTINLAVLKVDAPFAVTPIEIGDSDTVRVGAWAIAMGDPEGAERTFSVGTVAARPERDCYQEQLSRTYLQSSVRIHPESFGGPLLNLQGQVIGINTPRFDSDVENRDLTGVGSVYALPINLAMTVYEALKVEESKRSPWLGISVLDLTAGVRERYEKTPRTGVLIDNVFDPSPASRAGVRVGDFLTHMDRQRILAVPDFQRWLYLYGIGEETTLKIFRDGEVLELEVTIEERPESAVTN